MNTASISITARRRLVAVLGAVVALLGFALPTATPAQAWSWDSHVVLNGRVGCTYATSNTVQWMYVSGSNGEGGYARLSGSGMTRSYAFDFYRAPSNMNVTVSWGCSIDGRHQTGFGLARPAVGVYATRNVCYWAPCWI
jgi:hypothetical protein